MGDQPSTEDIPGVPCGQTERVARPTITKVVTVDKIKSLNCSIKREFYRVYRRTSDMPHNPYVFHEIKDVLAFDSKCAEKNVKLFGVYRYEQSGGHILVSTSVFTPGVTPVRVSLDMDSVEKFPVVDSFVEIYGTVRFFTGVLMITVRFFHEVATDQGLEFQKLLRKQAELSAR